MERFREDLGCACSSGGNIAIGYFEVARESGSRLCRIALWDYYKAAQETGSTTVPKFHWTQFRPVARATSIQTGNRQNKRRAQGFDIFISIVELY